MTRILTIVAAIAATTAMSSAAFANCNTTYCTSGSHIAPISNWSNASSSYQSAPSYSSATSYSAPSYSSSTSYSAPASSYSTSSYSSDYASYGVSNSYGGSLSSAEADAVYGSGSISSAYEGGDVEIFGFSGSTSSVPGLGSNQSLQPTDCPVSVHNPSGARVLGCYNVVEPVPQTSYYQVVRPVVYVRYPVAVGVPYYSRCGVVTNTSRYGANFGAANGNFGRRCG